MDHSLFPQNLILSHSTIVFFYIGRKRVGPKKTDLKIEEKHIEDARLNNYWGESVYRLVFIYKKDKLNDEVEFKITGQ